MFPSSTGAKDFLLSQNVYTDSGAHSDSKSIVSQTGARRKLFGAPQKSWESLNKNLELPREFLSSGWQYWTNLYALATLFVLL